MAASIILWLAGALTSARDDCDGPSGRSCGLVVSVDALTGCEYLRTIFGGVTPRKRRDGTQVCGEAGR
ncbi:MAG: hypothetical protein AB7K67_01025 [Hyphomicrobiaceae bacterium]